MIDPDTLSDDEFLRWCLDQAQLSDPVFKMRQAQRLYCLSGWACTLLPDDSQFPLRKHLPRARIEEAVAVAAARISIVLHPSGVQLPWKQGPPTEPGSYFVHAHGANGVEVKGALIWVDRDKHGVLRFRAAFERPQSLKDGIHVHCHMLVPPAPPVLTGRD